MPATHSAIPYSPNTHFLARHLFQQITTITIHLPLLLPVHCHHHLFTVVADCLHLCRRSPPLIAAAHSPSPEAELTETLWRFSEVIPIVSETHSVSFGYASLVRYSYYIPRQY
jgi:hypothetical protein